MALNARYVALGHRDGVDLFLVLVGAGLIGALYLQDRFSDLQLNTFFIGLLLVPLMALGALRGAMLQGLRRVVLGQLPEIIIRPSLLLLILLVVACLSSSGINADRAMEIHAVAALGAFAVGGIYCITIDHNN